MRRNTPKRAAQERAYSAQRRAYLAEHPYCMRCGRMATCVHHRVGREGARLTDERYWAASCAPCNDFAETHTGQALAENWLLPFGSYVPRED